MLHRFACGTLSAGFLEPVLSHEDVSRCPSREVRHFVAWSSESMKSSAQAKGVVPCFERPIWTALPNPKEERAGSLRTGCLHRLLSCWSSWKGAWAPMAPSTLPLLHRATFFALHNIRRNPYTSFRQWAESATCRVIAPRVIPTPFLFFWKMKE